MASGSSKGFDFVSDDILCSYEDYANQEQSNATHSESAVATKEFDKGRMARTSVCPTDDSDNQEVIILAVERSMKKHTDNVTRFLEGLSSRFSQLELYCYNLDKSIGEMRSDSIRDHGEADSKLKFLEKHLQEVHRLFEIWMIDLQVADTEKELAKLQFGQKGSPSTPDLHKKEQSAGQQLALVLAPQPQAYYLPPAPTQYQQSQMQPQIQPLHQYQQQWTPQVQPPPTMQLGSRPSSPQVYPQHPNSLPMQMTYSAIPPPGSNQPMAYSYGGPPPPPGFGGQPGDGYAGGASPNAYMVYDNTSGRVPQGGNFYPPNKQQSGGVSRPPPPQQQQSSSMMRNHPYNEVIDKLVSMGYRGDHVVGVIQRLDETGQTVDFNAVLDRLNGGEYQRGWSGYT